MSVRNEMKDLLDRFSEAAPSTKFSPYGSKGGQYWGRRASDSKVMRLKDAQAKAIIKKPSMSPDEANELGWLAVFWVPPEYVQAREGKWRVQKGFIKPAWSWERGSYNLKGDVLVSENFDYGAMDMEDRKKGAAADKAVREALKALQKGDTKKAKAILQNHTREYR